MLICHPARSSVPLCHQYISRPPPLPSTLFLSVSLPNPESQETERSENLPIGGKTKMDVYGISAPDYFRIDDLLDFSNDDFLSSSSSSANDHHNLPPPEDPSIHHCPSYAPFNPTLSTDFTDHLAVPSDDVAELEWLSQFVDDSFTEFPADSLAGTVNDRSDASFSGTARSKRSKGTATSAAAWTPPGKSKSKKETNRTSSPTAEGGVRRCTHCASEKTPQWRTGPLGPKTLCNACGVRYKSGRLVPEYRPAASPTFVLTQHSNSHRKVLELRRQKEVLRQQQQQQEQQQQHMYHHHHHHHHRHQDFEVC